MVSDSVYLDVKKEIIVSAKKTKNRILAIPAAPAAIPLKPSTAAIIAIMKNTNV